MDIVIPEISWRAAIRLRPVHSSGQPRFRNIHHGQPVKTRQECTVCGLLEPGQAKRAVEIGRGRYVSAPAATKPAAIPDLLLEAYVDVHGVTPLDVERYYYVDPHASGPELAALTALLQRLECAALTRLVVRDRLWTAVLLYEPRLILGLLHPATEIAAATEAAADWDKTWVEQAFQALEHRRQPHLPRDR